MLGAGAGQRGRTFAASWRGRLAGLAGSIHRQPAKPKSPGTDRGSGKSARAALDEGSDAARLMELETYLIKTAKFWRGVPRRNSAGVRRAVLTQRISHVTSSAQYDSRVFAAAGLFATRFPTQGGSFSPFRCAASLNAHPLFIPGSLPNYRLLPQTLSPVSTAADTRWPPAIFVVALIPPIQVNG